jgi:Glycosyl hydrolase family 48/Glycosyl hydrolase family 10
MALLLVVAQLALERQPSVAQTATLRQLASARGIFVGAAVDANALANEANYRTVLAREYSSVTAENAMKWGSVEPNKIKNPANGYFSPEGIPYHSVETLIVEAPDYGHETTSEAFSYWLWLEATYGQVTGDWTRFNNAWATMERYIIPSHADQPTNSFYNPADPATYAPENDLPSQYPTPLDNSLPTGQDPLAGELQSTYGTPDIYGMHWLLDVDNRYGFGHCGDGTTRPAFINTFQRGPQESVWETIPQPSCDTFAHGGPNGYLDLFIQDSSYARQWKYTDAPDADARAVQAAYWALTWATAQGKQSQISSTVANAAKMGDYLRYSLFDKYFKQQGNCTNASTCPGATGRGSADFLLGWYYAWGGANDSSAGWAWRIGDGVAHFGYQNPLAAWALSTVPGLVPRSGTAASDWSTSLVWQLQFYQWLQSAEGGIAGGAANSWGGHYGVPPAGDPTFFGMAYDFQPVYHDPPSNEWFGFQAWSMERVAEYYYANPNDARAKAVLDKWVPWAVANTRVNANGTFSIPSKMTWSGQPAANFSSSTGTPAPNPGLHVTILESGQDVGVAGALAKTLASYAAKSGNAAAKSTAKALLDALASSNYADTRGVSSTETRSDYNRFDDPVFVPSGWTGRMPNGDPINAQSTFDSIRSWYHSDPAWTQVQTYLNGGAVPSFRYHRFWAQADIATAQATFGILFPNG